MSGKPYVLHGGEISLFTRKLEAALRFYGLPFENAALGLRAEGSDVAMRAATHQVPVLETPENWMVADTTPLLALLDGRVPARRLFPEGPLGVLVHVVEEILDEWYARTMVHYRWHYEENTRVVVSGLVGREVSLDEARDHPVAQWGPRACRATGTESPHQQKKVEEEYLALVAALERQLGETTFALGDRPSAVDAILLGGLRAHTNADPVPDLSSYSRVVRWDLEGADRWDGGGELAAFPDSSPFAHHILEVGRKCYAPFVLGNEKALVAGDKAFTIDTYGEATSYLARPYPEQSRQYVKDRIQNQLDAAERAEAIAWLDSVGLADCFAPDAR